MKQFILICFLSLLSLSSWSQEITISPFAGVANPTSDFSEFSESGWTAGLNSNYFFSDHFGLGFQLSHQQNDFKSPFNYDVIPTDDTGTYSVSQFYDGSWSVSNIGLGPVYGLNYNKFSFLFSAMPGISIVSSPEALVLLQYVNAERELFQLEPQTITAFGMSAGVRFTYRITDTFSFFVYPEYYYSAAAINYSFRSIEPAISTNAEGQTEFDPIPLIEVPLEEASVSPTQLSVSAGVTFSFDVKTKKPKKEDLVSTIETEDQETSELENTCDATRLSDPHKFQEFYIDSPRKPNFRWENPSSIVTQYTFVLSEEGKEVYRERITEQGLQHNQKLQKIYERSKKETTEYHWKVITSYTKCKDTETDHGIFLMNRSSGTFHDVVEIECEDPPFTPQGMYAYKANLFLFHNTFASHPLEITSLSDITIINPTGAVITSLTDCSTGNPVSFPITIVPGGSATYCMTFEVPSGSASIDTQIEGNVNGNPQISTSGAHELPTCFCDICEEWEIDIQNQNVSPIVTGASTIEDYILIEDRLTAIAPFGNIVQVQAEVTTFEYFPGHNSPFPNQEQCVVCNKEDSQYGPFVTLYNGSSQTTQHLSGGFASGGYGRYLGGSAKSRNIVWQSPTPSGLALGNETAKLSIGVPKFAGACCSDIFKICVRYTFTAIDDATGACISCSEVVCYSVFRDENTVVQL